MQRVTFEQLRDEFRRILLGNGFSMEKSATCARVFAESTRDGVHSHGINRFPAFVESIRRKLVDPGAEPHTLGERGACERWDGRRGAGILNALFCMDRAIRLSRDHGIGMVALCNTNHWMRAGTYGLQAADAGCVGLCWTNTKVNLPPWGGIEPKLGNNPLCICIPRMDGHLLLDMAMSQFSYGRMSIAEKAGQALPVPGGFDEHGTLTDDPGSILRSGRPVPIGFWKGSGLALMLDCLAALLASGRATFQVGRSDDETDLSQVFIAIDPAGAGSGGSPPDLLDRILDDLHSATPLSPSAPARYPGERMRERRRRSDVEGILVDSDVWESVRAL